ncbi:MAG: prepilin peptidase [Oscillospiraceae bacterium]|nr:prepilin peptidase [Oscillospiraceae bacterium]
MEYLWGAAFGVLSVPVVLLMKENTNKRIREISADEQEKPSPYPENNRMCSILAVFVVISWLWGSQVVRYGVSAMAVLKLSLCYYAILAAAVIDFKLHIIPNLIPIILIGASALIFVYELLFGAGTLARALLSLSGCLIFGLCLLVGNRISGGGIGLGDVKLLSAVCLLGGIGLAFSTMVFALICCSLFAAVVLLSKKMSIRQSVPFGPFIYLGFVIMCLTRLF